MDKEALYFFSYAYPCSETLRDLGKLSNEEQDKLKKDFTNGNIPKREILEKSFPKAFERLDNLAKSMKRSRWDMEVLQTYWREEHNIIIDLEKGVHTNNSLVLKDLCKVHKAKIIQKVKEDLLKVVYNENQTRFVLNWIVPNAKIGDIVTIHYGFAVEII